MMGEEVEELVKRLRESEAALRLFPTDPRAVVGHITAVGDRELESYADELGEAAAAIESLRASLTRVEGENAWWPIETLGFGIEDHIVIATEYGFAWVVECDKDMDGEWLKRSYSKDIEHTGPVTHWRLLHLPQPTRLSRPTSADDK